MADYRCSIQGHSFIIPDFMVNLLERYIHEGKNPGGFLLAVIENDLKKACMFADENNILLLPAYASYLYNEAPSNCWGSPKEVMVWVKMIKEARDET